LSLIRWDSIGNAKNCFRATVTAVFIESVCEMQVAYPIQRITVKARTRITNVICRHSSSLQYHNIFEIHAHIALHGTLRHTYPRASSSASPSNASALSSAMRVHPVTWPQRSAAVDRDSKAARALAPSWLATLVPVRALVAVAAFEPKLSASNKERKTSPGSGLPADSRLPYLTLATARGPRRMATTAPRVGDILWSLTGEGNGEDGSADETSAALRILLALPFGNGDS